MKSLESLIENSKEACLPALPQTQANIRTENPNKKPWLLFFTRALQQKKQRLAELVGREKLMMAALPALAAKIVDETRKRGRITTGEIIRATGASRNTLEEHFKRLQAKGHLIRHGTGKGTWYALPLYVHRSQPGRSFRNHCVVSSRSISPAATAKVSSSHSGPSAFGPMPFNRRKTIQAPRAARLLPSING